MGSAFDTWNAVDGAYYMGVGTGWPTIWLVASIVLCVAALVAGARHEGHAYNNARDK